MKDNLYYGFLKTNFGIIKITTDENYLLSISFTKRIGKDSVNPPEILKETKKQLKEYFEGKRKNFQLNYKIEGTEFQRLVLEQVSKINFGEVKTYKQIAEEVNHPRAYRAVGLCNKNNRIPIIIPCHRVIGSDGSLTGYALGLRMKEKLLNFEKSCE